MMHPETLPYRELPDPAGPVARPRLWTLLVGALVTGVVLVVGHLLTMAVFVLAFFVRAARAGAAAPTPPDIAAMIERLGSSAPGILASGLVTALSFGGAALVAGLLSDHGARDRLRLGPSPRWFATGLVAMLQLLGLGLLSSQTAVLLGLGESGTLPLLRRAFADPPPPVLALALLILGVGAGVAEELFFRGYLLTRLEQRARPWIANLVVASLFALAHFDWVHSSFALLVGLAQGWTTRRSGSIRPAIVAHTFNNLAGVMSMALAGREVERLEPAQIVGGVALLALGTAGVAWLTRRAEAR